MIAALSTALTGLHASTARLAASASNVANAGSTGPLNPPPGIAPADARRAYVPIDVAFSSLPGGGVSASYQPRSPAHRAAYDPGSPDADARGLVAAPNVDLAAEALAQIEAALAYRANAAVIGTVDRMLDTVLDLTA